MLAISNTMIAPGVCHPHGGIPINEVFPSISTPDGPAVGEDMLINVGLWTQSPTSYDVEIYRGVTLIDTVNVPGNTTYLLVQADAGNNSDMNVLVVANNDKGPSLPAASNTIAQIFDAGAYALVVNGSYVDTTQRAVINNYFIAARVIDAFSNAICCHGIVGGTGAFHKWNWYDPQDTDAANRLTYSGGITHSANGMQGNGVTGSANPFINPSVEFPSTDFTWFLYSRTNQTRNEADFSASDATLRGLSIALRFGDNNTYVQALNSAEFSAGNINPNTGGFYLVRRSGGTVTIKRNDVTIYSGGVSGDFRVNQAMRLMCQSRTGSANAFFSSKQYTHFEFRKTALTDGQCTSFYNAVLAKETALGRNV